MSYACFFSVLFYLIQIQMNFVYSAPSAIYKNKKECKNENTNPIYAIK